MIIRDATPEDAGRMVPLLVQLGYSLDVNVLSEKIRSYSANGYKLLVGEDNLNIHSFIALHTFESFHSPGKVGRITAFCVLENSRSGGIGMQMLSAAEDFFWNNGCHVIEVTSNNRRTGAHQFYLHRGYIENSRKFVRYRS